MLRFELSEVGQAPLPAIDLDGDDIVIGSGVDARIRLPAVAARAEHVRVVRAGGAGAGAEGDAWRWLAVEPIEIDGVARAVGTSGAIGDGVVIAIGAYRVSIKPPPSDAVPATPQRTESLARELVRSLLGEGGAPTIEVEVGPTIGARRVLPAPPNALVIGRGDEAGWVILDEDLSRTHAEIRRGWDGMRIVDLGSKNGTRVDGAVVDDEVGVELADGAVIALGSVRLRFRDPAERHLRGGADADAHPHPHPKPDPDPHPSPHPHPHPHPSPHPHPHPHPRSRGPMWFALVIAAAAIAALVGLLR